MFSADPCIHFLRVCPLRFSELVLQDRMFPHTVTVPTPVKSFTNFKIQLSNFLIFDFSNFLGERTRVLMFSGCCCSYENDGSQSLESNL